MAEGPTSRLAVPKHPHLSRRPRMYTRTIQTVKIASRPITPIMNRESHGEVFSSSPNARVSSRSGTRTETGLMMAVGVWLKRRAARNCSELRSFPAAASKNTAARRIWHRESRYAMTIPVLVSGTTPVETDAYHLFH